MSAPPASFVPLHVKSHYSLAVGTASIRRLVDRAAVLGLPALALTDLENLYGQAIFHRAARERDLHPITGVEIEESAGAAAGARAPSGPGADRDRGPPRPGDRLVLLARDDAGYSNLCRIVTRRRLRSDRFGDPIAAVRDRLDGLFALTDSPRLARRLLGRAGEPAESRRGGGSGGSGGGGGGGRIAGSPALIDPEQLRLLLVRPAPRTPERVILALARELDIALVADSDVVLLDASDHEFHRLLAAIRAGSLHGEVARERWLEPPSRAFPGPRELARLFADRPEAVAETRSIAESCHFHLPREHPVFPTLDLPEGETPYSCLAELCWQGLRERHRRITPAALGRLSDELRVISELGFSEYFIIVGEIVGFAHQRRIEVVGRGSGAGSLVAYALGITNVDPIEHRLYFERFLHPGRKDLPDLDVDLCWVRRDEVIRHVYERYGRDRVAMVSSHVTYQPRSALGETLRAFGIPPSEARRHTRHLPHLHPEVDSASPLRDLLRGSPGADRLDWDEEPFRTALPLAERLLNQPRHLSVHPGGIVIADRSIDRHAPLEEAANGVVVTQYDKDSIEDIGLVKIDLLGNRCLSELQETLDLVAADGPRIELRDLPDRDPATVRLLASGATVGCFQLESPAMRALLRKMRPRGIRDCIAAVALIRPGAAAGGAKDLFIRRASGEEPVVYEHPGLRELLGESHGTVLYEEDVMCIASVVAGLSLAEGDRLRSALSKCHEPDDFVELENEFLRRAIHLGVEPRVARRVWEDLKRFASYCFSKAHASGYGLLGYQSAWLKAHHPAPLACALLNHHAGMYSTRTIAEEIRRLGVRVLPPCVQRSGERFTLEPLAAPPAEPAVESAPDPISEPAAGLSPAAPSGASEGAPRARPPIRHAVRVSLSRIKGLSARSRQKLLELRPFTGLLDLIRRAALPRREIEALVLSGALDGIDPPAGHPRPSHPQLLWELASAYERERGRGPADLLPPEALAPDYPPLADDSLRRRLQDELDTLGMTLSGHPVALLREELRRRGIITCAEALARPGKRVRIAGLVAATRRVRTRRGEFLLFVTFEDETELLEATLFPPLYRRVARSFRGLGPWIADGRIEEDHRALTLDVQRLEPAPLADPRPTFEPTPGPIERSAGEPAGEPAPRMTERFAGRPAGEPSPERPRATR